MAKNKQVVIINMLGTVLDQGKNASRWERWRPSVSLCQQDDLLISQYYLLYQRDYRELARRVIKDISQVSPETKVVPVVFEMKNPWDFQEVYGVLHDFAESLEFIPEKNDYLVHITTGTHVAQICLFLLTESRHLPGKLIQTSPPGKGRQRTAGPARGTYSIIDLDLSRYDQLAMRFEKGTLDDISLLKSGIQTKNHQFNRLIEKIETVAVNSREPILLMGPTGAGKSQLARRIYDLKKAHHQLEGAFVEVNCATIKGDQAMSALFGHTRGAYTGAVSDRPGLLKQAHRGICFLDEIAELGSDEQAMLLCAIEEKTFLPLGSDKEIQSDFQLICGTNKNLRMETQKGRFREDLLARINLWSFILPSLSDRREDIAPNIDYELTQITQRMGKKISINQEAREGFLAFALSSQAAWKANFRDLNAAVIRMATLAPGGRITKLEVAEEIERLKSSWETEDQTLKHPFLLKQIQWAEIDSFDQSQLKSVLEICQRSNSLSEAGRKLFNISRQNKKTPNDADRLRKYLLRFGLSWDDVKLI